MYALYVRCAFGSRKIGERIFITRYKEGGQKMCELFGISSKRNLWLNDYLKEFFSHCNEHPNGWGLACFDGNEAFIEKEPLKASKSKYLKERLSQPFCKKTAFAHIRKATVGNELYMNCHPFTKKDISKRRWTLIHNGTVFDYDALNRYTKVQDGDTDSERILLYLIDKINYRINIMGRSLDEKERFELLDSFFSSISKGNKMNVLLYDGEFMYAHTNYVGSLHYLKKSDGILFSTQPLSDEDWQPLPFTSLMAYREGELVYQGSPHGNEYIDNIEDLKYIYQIFSNL